MLARQRWRRPPLAGTRFVRRLHHSSGSDTSEPRREFHFKCTQCGKCCTGKGGRVRVNDREIVALQRELRLSSDELKAKYLTQASDDPTGGAPTWRIKQTDDDAQCVFLQGTKCSVYRGKTTGPIKA
jgi:Fe-S-cluster containining protein